jgi:hypothetical protein
MTRRNGRMGLVRLRLHGAGIISDEESGEFARRVAKRS